MAAGGRAMMTLLLCAMLFEATMPAPDFVQSLYEQAYSCKAAAPSSPAIERAERIPDYFATQPASWPLLTFDTLVALESPNVRSALPGILWSLPEVSATTRQHRQTMAQAVTRGARPVVALSKPDRQRQIEAMMVGCSIGLCPQAFYLDEGATQQLSKLLPATYISAPYAKGAPEWPLPHRYLQIDAQRLLPVLATHTSPRGPVAQWAMPNVVQSSASLWAPVLQPVKWQYAGIEFSVVDGELSTSLLGYAILAVYRASLMFWPLIDQGYTQVLVWLSLAFAWFSLLLIAFNLAWVAIGIGRHMITRGRAEADEERA